MRLRAQGERWVAELLSTLAKLTQRIEAIERHLGIAEGTSPEAASPRGTAGWQTGAAAGQSRPPNPSHPASPSHRAARQSALTSPSPRCRSPTAAATRGTATAEEG